MTQYTVDQLAALPKTCFTRDQIAALFAGRETVDEQYILNCPIKAEYKVFTFFSPGVLSDELRAKLCVLVTDVIFQFEGETRADLKELSSKAIAAGDLKECCKCAMRHSDHINGDADDIKAAEWERQLAIFRSAIGGGE